MQYIVQRNDTPKTIAWRFTKNQGRFVELVFANPQKPRSGNTFQTLTIGERLNLPASWPTGRFAGPGTLGQASDCPPGQIDMQDGNGCVDGAAPPGDTFVAAGDGSAGNAVMQVSGCAPGQARDANGNCIDVPPGGFANGCPPGLKPDKNGNCLKPKAGAGPVGPTPPPQPPGPLQPVALTTSSGFPTWVWWVVGGAAVVAGGGLVYYATKQKPHAAQRPQHPAQRPGTAPHGAPHPAMGMAGARSNPRSYYHRHNAGRVRLGR